MASIGISVEVLDGDELRKTINKDLGFSKRDREENIRRYRRLLNTQLTDIERSFVERRLAEELRIG